MNGAMQPSSLPSLAGVGFKPQHFAEIQTAPGPVGFFEVHAENYMGAGGPPHAQLSALRRDHSISIHGVGLSIGSARPLDRALLERVRVLCERYQPESFSEHLAWSSHGDVFLNDLLPLPYTQATLDRVADHVDTVQSVLGRQMLLENPATYLLFEESIFGETEFLAEIVRRTGCGLLLDVNNVHIASTNHNLDPRAYLATFPLAAVAEIHLAGHEAITDEIGAPLLIDTHGAPVADPVWALYADVLARTGPVATLIEWDNDVPPWPILRAEAEAASRLLAEAAARRAA